MPGFTLFKAFGLLNTYWALIVHYVARHQAFPVFVQRSFIASLPEELFKAARADGASHFQIYRQIVIPLSVSILITITIIGLAGHLERLHLAADDRSGPGVNDTHRRNRRVSVTGHHEVWPHDGRLRPRVTAYDHGHCAYGNEGVFASSDPIGLIIAPIAVRLAIIGAIPRSLGGWR